MSNSLFLTLPLILLLLVLIRGCNASISAQLINGYSLTMTPVDGLRTSFRRDVARFKNKTSSSVSSTVSFAGGVYLMSLNIGTPPMTIVAQVDTGSDLTWIQCQPCLSCYTQNLPIYDPSNSSTYTSVPCHTQSCSSLLSEAGGNCDPNTFCSYTYVYVDLSQTTGVLSTETFSIGNTTSASIPNVLFGCSHYTNNSNGLFDPSYTGVVGLGGGPLSLVSQLGPYVGYVFSYCLAPFDSSVNATSSIVFGHSDDNSLDVAGVPTKLVTPLLNNSQTSLNIFYTVRLESVSVAGGDSTINVASPAEHGQGNIIVDSGSTFTYLKDSVLEALTDEVRKVVTYPTTQDPHGDFPLCFNITGVKENMINLPDFTFQFSGGPLTLKPINTFTRIQKNISCLAMASSSTLDDGTFDIQIFGYMSQWNFRIEYDIQNHNLSFAPSNCGQM